MTERYLILYGASLHPRLLAARFAAAGVKPISSQTVQIPNSYLAFNFKNIPFFEPVCCNAIVRGVNDSGGEEAAGKLGEITETSEGYQRWLWARTSPGLLYSEGLSPPILEGVAYRFSISDYNKLVSSSDSSPSPFVLIEIEAHTFTRGNDSIILDKITGSLPIVVDPQYLTEKPALPTLRHLRLNLLGSFFSMLSQPFIGHLVLLRHTVPSNSLSEKLKRFLYFLVLLPGFISTHLPYLVFSKILGQSKGIKRKYAGDLGWRLCTILEKRLGIRDDTDDQVDLV